MSSVTFMRPSRIKWAPWGCIIVTLNPVYPLVKVFDDFAGELPVQHGQLACHKLRKGTSPVSHFCSSVFVWIPRRKRAKRLLIRLPIIVPLYSEWSNNVKTDKLFVVIAHYSLLCSYYDIFYCDTLDGLTCGYVRLIGVRLGWSSF